MRLLRGIPLALQFLTVMPVKITGPVSPQDISSSSIFFPLVGAFQGLLLSACPLLLLSRFSADTAGAMVVLLYILSNGGFHFDGLSDTFDALSVKSTGNRTSDREKRLKVMKDSTTGSIGVVSLCLALLLKYVLIREIIIYSAYFNAYLILFLMPVLSKWTMVVAMYRAAGARKDGLGMMFLENTKMRHLVLATLVTFVLGFGAFPVTSLSAPGPFLSGLRLFTPFLLSGMAILAFFTRFLTGIFTRTFGGLTGDSFGAVHEISEIIFLVIACLWK
ncbi:MAG: adenosylcobinamide-GDP ribazoletransferase [Syntrophorhabdus aromaticivorans]|uniref:Adenosylcobinamide-GDP ribazoletransferase n=1 Tax=Syntrophorhabdus aromaticivorans TaxID=328301 RepID=A0A351U467_9BACT|nr:adenosylcobinamide-GDP ribazoletransferase [Syntrophorhabdus aromaticivorans]HBA54748.1 adenosylcobinamide-GDP ribazoletransferase [Syntrophorhabdus aromaticivorans]